MKNNDGFVAQPLDKYTGALPGLEEKIRAMFDSLLMHKAAVSEIHRCNLLVKVVDDEEYELHLVDGFGNSDFVKICDYSRTMLRKKLVRKFRILCRELEISPDFLVER